MLWNRFKRHLLTELMLLGWLHLLWGQNFDRRHLGNGNHLWLYLNSNGSDLRRLCDGHLHRNRNNMRLLRGRSWRIHRLDLNRLLLDVHGLLLLLRRWLLYLNRLLLCIHLLLLFYGYLLV